MRYIPIVKTFQWTVLLFILLRLCNISSAWQKFLRGRAKGSYGYPIVSKSFKLPDEFWFQQRLDHYDPTNMRMWQQRYFVNSTHHQSGGPVFVLIGGEAAINAVWMIGGQWLEYAKQYGAIGFQLEHRFYGKSHPTSDMGVENLKYLTIKQALADLAYFIKGMSHLYQMPLGTKWIVFGGSYSGSLAVWMRDKYPHLVHGAVSSSGPLLAQIDFQQYYVVVENSLKTHSQACVDTISSANTQIHSMLSHRSGRQSLREKFKLCDPIDPSERNDISNLYETLAENLGEVVQYNEDNRMSSKIKNYTINIVCDILVDEKKGSSVDRLAEINSLLLAANTVKCLDFKYDKMIDALRNVSWDSDVADGSRQWLYQTCTEFGFFQTSTARPNLFSETFFIDFFIQQCTDVFGPKYNICLIKNGVERTNIVYGGLDLEVSNVVYVHGSIDPWHALGITKSSNPKAPAIYINGTAHCADMYPARSIDLPQLVAARQKIGNLIGQWLKYRKKNIRHEHLVIIN